MVGRPAAADEFASRAKQHGVFRVGDDHRRRLWLVVDFWEHGGGLSGGTAGNSTSTGSSRLIARQALRRSRRLGARWHAATTRTQRLTRQPPPSRSSGSTSPTIGSRTAHDESATTVLTPTTNGSNPHSTGTTRAAEFSHRGDRPAPAQRRPWTDGFRHPCCDLARATLVCGRGTSPGGRERCS